MEDTLQVCIGESLFTFFCLISTEKAIERFHSRDKQPYWITETKESIYIKMNSIPGELVWYTIMAAISLFWETNMAAVTSCENALLFRDKSRLHVSVFAFEN